MNSVDDDTPAFKKFDILGEKCQVCANREFGCYKYCVDYSNFKSVVKSDIDTNEARFRREYLCTFPEVKGECSYCQHDNYLRCCTCNNFSNFKSVYIRKWEEMSLKDQNTNPAPNKERNFDEAVVDLKKIIEHYSSQNQHIQAIQELAELTVAITKHNTENIVEECIDATIMIDQLLIIYGVSREEIIRRYNAKIDRTLERMKAEERTI